LTASETFGYGKYLELNDRTLLLLRTAREFRSRFIDPHAHAVDRKMLHDPHYHAHDIMARGCEYGLMSMPVPSFLGGGDAGIMDCAVVLEELCAGCAGIANLFGAHYLGLSCVLLGLSFHQFDTVIREVVEKEKKGEPVVFAAAVTEPMAGTDVEDEDFLRTARLTCFAKKVPGGYVLNGTKVFISNGSVAKYTAVCCATSSRYPAQTWSAFLVPAGTKGFSADKVELKMGMRACHAAMLVFEDCFIPDSFEMGVTGSSTYLTEVVLAASRAPVAAIATGIARGAYERTLDYCRNRRCGNGRLIERQWVQMALADMFSMVQAARNTYLHAGYLFDKEIMGPLMGNRALQDPMLKAFAPLRRTPPALKLTASPAFRRATVDFIRQKLDDDVKDMSLALSSMSKFTCSDLAVNVCLKALEILGPAGAEERNFVEKSLRDVKLAQIYEGTNQLNRHVLYKKHIRGGIHD
jgi:butyryl-CoA dehydrogenase